MKFRLPAPCPPRPAWRRRLRSRRRRRQTPGSPSDLDKASVDQAIRS